jgi:hypothetical protein
MAEVRANKLSTARFKAEGYRPIEISFDDIRAQNFKLTLQSNMSHMIEGIQVTEDHRGSGNLHTKPCKR